MNQQAFLKSLKEELQKYQVQNIDDILADYDEHFVHGLRKNKTEKDISASLGTPASIAKAYQTELMIKEIKNPENRFQWRLALEVLGRLLLIAPFNFFVLFIPGVVIFSLMVSGWAVAIAFGAVGLALLAALPILGILSANGWAWLAGISTSFGLFGMSVLAGMTLFVISKYILLMLINYLQWNLKFIVQK